MLGWKNGRVGFEGRRGEEGGTLASYIGGA
jgi:hypothetical protein